ncbi:unnamed protein product [Rotaria magnacalcarata]|uniref:Uncharacterized protein n=1 Tax=Rotaria magnacalcarata TaxID=392030 RepID=A0A816C9X7_9BILA|nr:unnamed protein product [Rotaria magnacalcarata]CAF1621660.1 unnamed protein product [Rotaria magnacalcarata]CAF1991433.1 unnamed protein product [Rotaria magnacalcarata]CAF2010685.1 unnamed protein product [Rotaria magnacalcarata]CAF2118597.1 unnamed protein product [Rotaria magnacalcarata]
MYLFTIISALICIELVITTSSESSEVMPTDQLNPRQPLTTFDDDFFEDHSQNDDENENARRSTSFLRFGRRGSPASGSFLRFGRDGHRGETFLRFGRSNPPFSRFSRNGQNGGKFLRFGREVQDTSPSNNFRVGRKSDFLRFG